MRDLAIQAAWHGLAECASCAIRDLVLFADLTSEDFSSIHLPIEDIWLPPGTQLYCAGDAGGSLYTIREGLLKLEQYLPDGTRRIVNLLGQGHVGGLEIMSCGTYEHTAIALQSSTVCRIPKEVVLRLAPKLHTQLINKWHDSMVQTQACLREFTSGSARQRLARLFLMLPSREGVRFQLFSREDVGALLGVTPETASRTVGELKRAGAVREISSNLFERDIPELERIAGEK